MHTTVIAWVIIGTSLCISAKDADAQRRQADVHVHGNGTLNVVIEKSAVAIELRVPAIDFLGFEQAPTNAAQRATVSQLRDQLIDVASILTLPKVASCTLTEHRIDFGALDVQPAHHGLDHHVHSDRSHNDILATYRFECVNAARISQIDVSLFQRYTSLKSIRAQIITENGQHAVELNAQNSTLVVQ